MYGIDSDIISLSNPPPTPVMDTLGLAIFTVIGIEVALATRPDAGNFLLVFVGVFLLILAEYRRSKKK